MQNYPFPQPVRPFHVQTSYERMGGCDERVVIALFLVALVQNSGPIETQQRGLEINLFNLQKSLGAS